MVSIAISAGVALLPAVAAYGALRQQVKAMEEQMRTAKVDCDRRIERLEQAQDTEVIRLEDKLDGVHSRINGVANRIAEFRSDLSQELGEIKGKLDAIYNGRQERR